jgi:cytochrome c oxidase assembly protein subunit 15
VSSDRGFGKLATATIGAVYFLILVGGLVRASGAGMGCPDWPRCFGSWVPPTSEAQLPANYQEIYAEHGYGETRFNAVKTWTEYVNRLIGVGIGFLVFATLVSSRRFWASRRAVVWWSLAAFLLVGFEGWLGSVVVASNLTPWVVTLHMVVALFVVAALLAALAEAEQSDLEREPVPDDLWIVRLLGVALLLSLVQIALGTQVREGVDRLMVQAPEARATWMGSIGAVALVHRSFSLAVLAANGLLVWRLRAPASQGGRLRRYGTWLMATLVVEVAAGAGLFYFGVPAFLQPVHLLMASIACGLQLMMAIVVLRGRRVALDLASASSAAA